MSIAAYKTTIRESESPRQIERRVLTRLTGRLAEQVDSFDRAEGAAARVSLLAQGLREDLASNQKFWSELKYDLAQPSNGLPADLRAGLISIALWVDRQTSQVMGGGTGLGALVEVNRSIAAGLAGQTPGQAAVA